MSADTQTKIATQNILVTGASGFTGGRLAAALLRDGHTVRALVRPTSRLQGLSGDRFNSVVGDVTDAAAVDRACEGVDAVYHIAAAYREYASLKVLRSVNVDGTRNVLEAALRHGVKRVVHCSTAGVHGDVDNPPADENAPFKPGDDYQVTKLEGEEIARDYMRKGLGVSIVRPVGIYGPGDLRFLKLFRAIKSGKFVMFGNGKTLYHLTYIDDIVRGFIAAGEHPAAVGQTYIVSGTPAVTLNELVARVAASMNVAPPRFRLPFSVLWLAAAAFEAVCAPLKIQPPIFRRRADWFRKDRSFTSEKLRRELGVSPQVGIEEGLRRTAEWYAANGLI